MYTLHYVLNTLGITKFFWLINITYHTRRRHTMRQSRNTNSHFRTRAERITGWPSRTAGGDILKYSSAGRGVLTWRAYRGSTQISESAARVDKNARYGWNLCFLTAIWMHLFTSTCLIWSFWPYIYISELNISRNCNTEIWYFHHIFHLITWKLSKFVA